MDERERESQEAWKRLDGLRADAESRRFGGRAPGGPTSSCLSGCGGVLACILVTLATVVMLIAVVSG